MGLAEERLLQADVVIDALFSEASPKFLRSAISREEGVFLRTLASGPGIQSTIEVGCARGISGLYICSGIAGKENCSHTAIDPFQTSEYSGQGANNIRRAGFDFLQVIEEPSELALAALLNDGARFDMAFIDGFHTTDQAMVDFYFLDRLLRVGGIMVFDDVPTVNKVVRYVSTYPNYRLIGTAGKRGWQRRVLNVVKQAVSIALWPLRWASQAFCREFFDISLVHPKTLWTVDFCTMAAFEKTSDYKRGTNWYEGI